MKKMTGYPLPLGISEKNESINFSMIVESGKTCILRIYKKGAEVPEMMIELSEADAVGEVRFAALPKAKVIGKEYNYEIDGKNVLDAYAKSVTQSDPVRGKIILDEYDWEGDKPLNIPCHEVIAYNMHVRGFTKHSSSKVKKKGTFLGVIEKIPYLKELGINQIQCMPVYSFEETEQYKNYWGYGEAFCFAVKNSYASGNTPEKELKDMIKECHKNGIEVVLNLPFTETVSKELIEACLCYYVTEYHVDGFILNPFVAPMEKILSNPLLKKTKIFQNKNDFQTIMRRYLKGDEGMVEGVIWWLKQTVAESGSCNYITNHTGFTLADLVSYNEKHNELNGENNQDGPDDNYSWNCGVEGHSRKKAIREFRKKQMRNAMCLLMTAQGTPCILAGDEFGNSQNGNNNVYCQDNEIAWLDWRNLEKEKEFFEFVKYMIAMRKKYPVLYSRELLQEEDKINGSVPYVSYHGANAWQVQNERQSRQLGVYYHGNDDTDCFIAYNMHWKKQKFALPLLDKEKKWYPVFSTADEKFAEEYTGVEQREIVVDGRTIVMFEGRQI